MNKKLKDNLLSRKEIEAKVRLALEQLLANDSFLLRNDVSERAVTHKLAEYLQIQFPDLNVDCEYNRNVELGEYAQKLIYTNRPNIQEMAMAGSEEDELLAVSTYPDIIVHQRGHNNGNLLIVEVKKRNSNQSHDWDRTKLKAFTQKDGKNRYHYTFGVFVVLNPDNKELNKIELAWCVNGYMENSHQVTFEV